MKSRYREGPLLVMLLACIGSVCWGQTAPYREPNIIVLDKRNSIFSQINTPNQKYEIRDVFDLKGNTLKVPKGCEINFNGGEVRNGVIESDCLMLNEWHFDNVKIEGNVDFVKPISVPVDNPKSFITTILEHKPIVSNLPTVFVFSSNQVYNWDGELYINKKNVTLTGGGTIEGHIHIGVDAETFMKNGFDSYKETAHSNIIISNLRFSKYGIIGTEIDPGAIRRYIISAEPEPQNIAISVVNSCNVKIEGCFFDNVPYPIVYTPNSIYVNQNVRRLNVVNCDFELCHTAILAPSIVNNSYEYGDLIFSNNNVFPTNFGLDVSCIDGFKVSNNTFNTCLRNQNGVNIRAFLPGQVVVTNNSFYGEHNNESVIIDSPGTAIIDGNLFSAQGIENPPSEIDKIACLRIIRTVNTKYTSGIAITNNLFTDVNRLPIFADGYFRSTTITGNTVSCKHYSSNKRTLFYINSFSREETRLQPFRMTDNLLEDVSGTLTLRMDVINDMMNSNSLYPDETWQRNLKTYVLKKGEDCIPVRIIGCRKAKPIYVVSPVHTSYKGDIPFIFNGVEFKIKVELKTTDVEVLERIIKELKPTFGNTHDFKIIDNLLWIVGKDSTVRAITPMCESSENLTPYRFEVVYQNLGYNITIKDTDNKNFVNTPLYNCGIDSDDEGKIVRFGNVLTVLNATKTNRKAELVFKDRPVLKDSYKWLYNDMFFACGNGGRLSTNKLLAEIVSLCYSDRTIVKGNTLILNEPNKEYGINSTGNTWYSTYNRHVANYKFVTETGIEYDPDKGTFNNAGPSSARPMSPTIGFQFFDTTIGRPVYWNGSFWVDSEGKKR